MGKVGARPAALSLPPHLRFLFWPSSPPSSRCPPHPSWFSLFKAQRCSVSMWSSPTSWDPGRGQMQLSCQMHPGEWAPPSCGDEPPILSHRRLE